MSQEDRKKKRFIRVDELDFPEQTAVQGWLKGYAKAVLIVRQVFKNRDDSTGILHLVCSDLTCDYDAIPLELQKTVAGESISKTLEVQCQPGQVPRANRANRANPKQPRLHGDLRHVQA